MVAKKDNTDICYQIILMIFKNPTYSGQLCELLSRPEIKWSQEELNKMLNIAIKHNCRTLFITKILMAGADYRMVECNVGYNSNSIGSMNKFIHQAVFLLDNYNKN
jgi:hypothetical protein